MTATVGHHRRRGSGYNTSGTSTSTAGPATLDFAVDWGTQPTFAVTASNLDPTLSRIKDTGKTLPFDTLTGNGLANIIDPTGMGFPAGITRVLNIDFLPIQTPPTVIYASKELFLNPGHFGDISIGDSVYFRWYMRWGVGLPEPLGNGNHPVQDDAGAPTNFEMCWDKQTGGDAFRPSFVYWNNGPAVRYKLGLNASPIYLTATTAYRFELQLKLTAATLIEAHVKIFDDASDPNTPLYGDTDFYNNAAQAQKLSDNLGGTLGTGGTGTSALLGIRVGSNGPGPDAGYGFVTYSQAIQYAAVAMRRSTVGAWIGPYVAGESV